MINLQISWSSPKKAQLDKFISCVMHPLREKKKLALRCRVRMLRKLHPWVDKKQRLKSPLNRLSKMKMKSRKTNRASKVATVRNMKISQVQTRMTTMIQPMKIASLTGELSTSNWISTLTSTSILI